MSLGQTAASGKAGRPINHICVRVKQCWQIGEFLTISLRQTRT
jgi:hypothetical protein